MASIVSVVSSRLRVGKLICQTSQSAASVSETAGVTILGPHAPNSASAITNSSSVLMVQSPCRFLGLLETRSVALGPLLPSVAPPRRHHSQQRQRADTD
jgi:hypothetical protein